MKILRILNEKLEEVFLVILMTAATLIVTAQIVTRYVFKIPLPWSEEVARYLFIWLVWVGASYATKERKHICIDVVTSRLPKAGKKVCAAVSAVVWILFLIFMAGISLKLTASVYSGSQIAVGSKIPMWVPYAAIPTGMILMLFRLLQNCYYDIRGIKFEDKEGMISAT
ncbi:MAG: TRAP transporter small permease [Lacrimispora saccharolytica]